MNHEPRYQLLREELNNPPPYFLAPKKDAWTPIRVYFNTAGYQPTIIGKVLISFDQMGEHD
jgi:hypothetical protein